MRTHVFVRMKNKKMTISHWARMWGVPPWKAQVRLNILLQDGIVKQTTLYIDDKAHQAYSLIKEGKGEMKKRRKALY